MLGPLEAINGLLFFGLSTAVLFAIMSELIAHRLRTETGYKAEAACKVALFRWQATRLRTLSTRRVERISKLR